MKNWKKAAAIAHTMTGNPDLHPTDQFIYQDYAFYDWETAMKSFLASRTHYEKCDTIRKEAIASILDQFKEGKTLVKSEQAYIQNGDSGWDWVGRISADGAIGDITERNLSFHTYDTIGDDPDEEFEGKDIWSHIDDISTDCLCAVADNLYA